MSRMTAPLPADGGFKFPLLMREAFWAIAIIAYLCLAVSLLTHDGRDPGFGATGFNGAVLNRLGHSGAWLADLVFALLGEGAWLLLAGLAACLWRAFPAKPGAVPVSTQHLPSGAVARALVAPVRWATLGAGVVMLVAGGALLGAEQVLPRGVPISLTDTGGAVGRGLVWALGLGERVGGDIWPVMVGLSCVLIALPWVFGFSWLPLLERIGGFFERKIEAAEERREVIADRKVGEIAAYVREEKVEEIKRSYEEHEPIKIEAPVPIIRKSEKVIRQQQAQLFVDIPESDLPPISLLDSPPASFERPSPETIEYYSRLIEKKLADFKVSVKVHAAHPGPVITRYEIEPATGIKGSQIQTLSRDLARELMVTAIRVVDTIPGTAYMGLELPNAKRETVRLSEIVGSKEFQDASSKLMMVLGKDIAGKPAIADLAKMPHVLVAGTTGSGKSVAINAMLVSLLYKATANELRMILIDPKMLELSVYEGIPHLLAPVVTDMKQAGNALNWCVAEMERRYKLLSALGVRNLASFNNKINEGRVKGTPVKHPFSLTPEAPEPLENLPLIVVVIDELADLMMVTGKKVEEQIARIAQKARAAGIHLVLATQRPSVDVITGLIKANVPTRISFQVSSKIDSRTILDQSGAESLLGMGDMLYMAPGTGLPLRNHGAFVSDDEVHAVVEFLKSKGEPRYIEGVLDGPDMADASNVGADGIGGGGGAGGEADPLYDQAVKIVLENKRATISLVQRHLRIGYNRAARLLEDMEKSGLVSSLSTSGQREIIAQRPQE